MGSWNLATLKDETFVLCDQRSEVYPRLTRAINMAQRRVARAHRWEELKHPYWQGQNSFTSNKLQDSVLKFGFTLRDIYSLVVLTGEGDARSIELMTKKQFDELYPEPEFFDRNQPVVGFIAGRYIGLFPCPDKAYTFRASMDAYPAELESDGDISELEYKDDILVHLAASYLWVGHNRERSAELFNIAKNMINEAIASENEKPAQDIKPLFEYRGQPAGPYWRDPWVKGVR